jgi:hypothetical protein
MQSRGRRVRSSDPFFAPGGSEALLHTAAPVDLAYFSFLVGDLTG